MILGVMIGALIMGLYVLCRSHLWVGVPGEFRITGPLWPMLWQWWKHRGVGWRVIWQ